MARLEGGTRTIEYTSIFLIGYIIRDLEIEKFIFEDSLPQFHNVEGFRTVFVMKIHF